MATKQEIIDRLSQCGGLSYQDWIRLLDSIYFDGEIGDVYIPTTSNILPQNENSFTTFSIITEGTYTQSNGSPIVVPEGHIAIISNESGVWFINGNPINVKGDMPEGTDTLESEEIPKGKAVSSYIYNEIAKYAQSTYINTGLTLSISGQIYLKSNGTLTSSSGGNSSNKVDYDHNKKYYVSGQMQSNSSSLVLFFDSSDNYLGSQYNSDSAIIDFTRQPIVPIENTAKMAFSSYGAGFKLEELIIYKSASVNQLNNVDGRIDVTNSKLDNITSLLPQEYINSGVTNSDTGHIYLKNGTRSTSSAGSATPIIDIDSTKDYYLTTFMTANSAACIVYFNASGVFISNEFPANGSNFTLNRQKLTSPSGASKMAMSTYDGDIFKLEYTQITEVASKTQADSNTERIETLESQENLLKATVFDVKMSTRELELRTLYNQKIIENPSYVAPYYGVQWSEVSNADNVTRVGNDMSLHASLPIQNKIRRCVMKDGVLQYYLDADNSLLKEDGVTPAVLDGTDGDVMVEIPEFFYKATESGLDNVNKQLLLSEEGLPNYKYSPKHYISAFETTVDRDNDKLASVVNTLFSTTERELIIESETKYIESTAGYSLGTQKVLEITGYTTNATKYRGVTNDASLDIQTDPASQNYARNQLGRPVSNIHRTTAKNYAKNAEGFIQQYDSQKALWMLVLVEYATRNIQQPFQPNDANGYRQGGLGNGAVNYPAYSAYEAYFAPQGGNAFIPNGCTVQLGNKSGEVYFLTKNVPVESTGSGSTIVYARWGNVPMAVMSYRGIEHFYGHIYKIVDNITAQITNITSSDNKRNEYYYQPNPYLTTNDDSVKGYKKIGDYTFPSSIKVVTKLIFGTDAHILPRASGGNSASDYLTNYADCVEHTRGWDGNTGMMKYLTYNGRAVSGTLVGTLFSVIVIDVNSNRTRKSDGVRLQYFDLT